LPNDETEKEEEKEDKLDLTVEKAANDAMAEREEVWKIVNTF